MIAAVALGWLGCTSAPAPAPVPPPPPGTVLVPHAPPMRPIPDDRPADPAQFTIRSDGLGVLDLVVGTGAPVAAPADPPGPGGVIAVAEITSWAPDGTRWDSTRERREPARWVVGGDQVVPGWNAGVVGMQPGGVRQLLVPPALGFEHGIAGRLPPGPTITQIELLQILVPPVSPVTDGEPVTVGGLVVRDVRAGDGPVLSVGATARIDYVGWLADGTAVDSSFVRSAPFVFPYGRGLVRWEAAFEGMRAGGRRQIEVPSALAFGAEGRPPVVPPGASLVYAVDLHGIE